MADKFVEEYGILAKIPTLSSAHLLPPSGNAHDFIGIESSWKQRDLQRMTITTFSRTMVLDKKSLFVKTAFPPRETSDITATKISPCGKLHAVVKKYGKGADLPDQYLEIWDADRKILNVEVVKLSDKHGPIYNLDGYFGALAWSINSRKVMYVAEKAKPKGVGYFKSKDDPSDAKTSKGNKYVFESDWGEQMEKKQMAVVCVHDIQTGDVEVFDCLPGNVCAAQPVWAPDGNIVCVGWSTAPLRLGIIYCPIRKSSLYVIDCKTKKASAFGPQDKCVRSPRFSRRGSALVFLENDAFGAHMQCSRLVMVTWETRELVTLVDLVEKPKKDGFPGLFTVNLPEQCWTKDGKFVLTSTFWRSKKAIIAVDVEKKEVRCITPINDKLPICVWTLHTIGHDDIVVATASAPNIPHCLAWGKLTSGGECAWHFTTDVGNPSGPVAASLEWSVLKHNARAVKGLESNGSAAGEETQRSGDENELTDFESILLMPKAPLEEKSPAAKTIPLIVYPHGGPHGVFSGEFSLYLAGFVRCGYAVLLINYRGSAGFGNAYINLLPGNIGEMDVNDCYVAVQDALAGDARLDAGRLGLCGGSHGGFLVTHLAGQLPDVFCACVARNPVVNLTSMFPVTDIPDWTLCEAGLQAANADSPYGVLTGPADLAHLWNCSPIKHAHKIKIPMMLMIGAKDRRVPPSQGLELHNYLQRLKGRDAPSKLLLYPEDNHPLDGVECEADAFVNISMWFKEHLSVQK